MQFRPILALIALTIAGVALAQPKGDDLILDMHQAAKRGDKRKLAQLLPQLVAYGAGEHIGGCDDLELLESTGRLDPMLGRNTKP